MAELLQALETSVDVEVCDDVTTAEDTIQSCLRSNSRKRHPNHHVGPMDLSYAEDSQRRCKSFFKRRKTIFDKANQLTSICGASVSIKLKSQTGQLYEYKSGEYQQDGVPGVPMISVQPSPAPRGRPRKLPAEPGEDDTAPKAQGSYPYQPLSKRTPCAICKKVDSWLACQKPGCSFWAHARCMGFVAMNPTDMSSVKFFCPKHIPPS